MKVKLVSSMLCGTTVKEYQRTVRGAILLMAPREKLVLLSPPFLSVCVSGVAQLMESGVNHVASYA